MARTSPAEHTPTRSVFSQDPTGCRSPTHNTACTHNLNPNHQGQGHNVLLRKEVIQPHLPVRLPCYDFVPIASPTFDGSLPKRG